MKNNRAQSNYGERKRLTDDSDMEYDRWYQNKSLDTIIDRSL